MNGKNQNSYKVMGLDNSNPQTNPGTVNTGNNPPNKLTQQQKTLISTTTDDHIYQAAEDAQSLLTAGRKRGRLKKIFFVMIFFILISLVTTVTATYAVAYNKVELSDKLFQRKVAHFVMSYIPFAPATPQFILEKTALSHKDVKKSSYDLSLAIKTDQGLLTDLLLENFDVRITGALDIEDPNNILATADISITTELGLQFMTKDNILYFKVSKFPTKLFTLLNIDPKGFDQLIDQWVEYDANTIDSEARDFLDQEMLLKEEEQYNWAKDLNDIFDEKILENITVSSESYEGQSTYKLEFVASDEIVDYLVEKASETKSDIFYNYSNDISIEKPSNYIKEIKVVAWIEKETFYTRKIIFSTTIISDDKNLDVSTPLGFFPGSTGEKMEFTIAGALLLGNFGKEVVINIPDDTINMEKVYEILNKAIYQDSYTDTYDLPLDYFNDSAPEDEIPIEELFPEYYYEFEDVSDVLGWFDQKLNERENDPNR